MFDDKIITIEQAKKFYQTMGCSGFHMCREYPHRYSEYQKLNISKRTEKKWILECFDDYYQDVMNMTTDRPLWAIHSGMSELVTELKTKSEITKMLTVTQYITDIVSIYDRVIIAETINGRGNRKSRSGLIYLSYDNNFIDIAKEFVNLSLYYSTYVVNESREFDRCNEATVLCTEIKKELRL